MSLVWDYDAISAQITRGGGGNRLLSPATLVLCLSALSQMESKFSWSELTDTELDDVDMWVSGSYTELLTEVACGGDVPIGAIIAWTGKAGTAIPDGYLPCNGTQYDRVDYPDLYSISDASLIVDADTFETPNLNGRFLVGTEQGVYLGDTGGESEHTLTVDEMPAHDHSFQQSSGTGSKTRPGSGTNTIVGATTSATGGGEAHNNLPPYMAIRWIIKAE